MQSIASVVQAVQPVEEIPTVEVGWFGWRKAFVERLTSEQTGHRESDCAKALRGIASVIVGQ